MPGVGQARVRIGRDQQERLRSQPARADAGDVGEQLVAVEAERADDARAGGGGRPDGRKDGSWLGLAVEQAADEAADQTAAALALGVAARALGHRRVVIGALQPDAARAGEAVEDEVAAAAQEAGLEPVDLLGHLHGVIAVDPAARLDVDRLAGFEHLLEHVAVAVHPDDALLVGGEELIHEEAAAVEHVGEALDTAVVVLDVGGGGQELVLAHHDPVAGRQVQGGDMTGCVAAEGDLARGLSLDQEQRHAAERAALEALLERVQADLHGRVLPEQHVVLEVHRHLAVEGHVQHGHELALEAIVQPGRGALRDRGGKDGWGRRHLVLLKLTIGAALPATPGSPAGRYRD